MIDKTIKFSRSALVRELERAGTTFTGNSCRCPFHDDQHASAGIFESETGWRFKCQSCGVSGDIFDILGRNAGQSPFVSQRATGGDSGAKYRKSATSSKPSRIFADIEALADACPAGTRTIYQYTNPKTGTPDMIVIRVDTPEGKTIRQARPCIGGFEMKSPEAPRPIYNRSRILTSDTVLVVEGEKCVHALHDYGTVATTSPMGAGKADYADWRPLTGKRVIVWPDNDEPGRKHMNEVIKILEQLEPAPAISVIDPATLDLAPKEDAFDFIQKLKSAGKTPEQIKLELDKVIDAAKPFKKRDTFIARLVEIVDDKFSPIETGLKNLDRLCPILQPKSIMVLYGDQGSTKSFFLSQMILHWLDAGIKVISYQLENDIEFYLYRALAQLSGISDVTDPKWLKTHAVEALELYEEHKAKLQLFEKAICPAPKTQPTYQQLSAWAKNKAVDGYRIIAIDPLTGAVQTEKSWLDQSQFIHQLKAIAEECRCSFLLIHHSTKANKNNPAVMAGSNDLARFTDSVWKLEYHDEPVENHVRSIDEPGTKLAQHNRILYTEKNRHGKGRYKLALNFENCRMIELGIIMRK